MEANHCSLNPYGQWEQEKLQSQNKLRMLSTSKWEFVAFDKYGDKTIKRWVFFMAVECEPGNAAGDFCKTRH
jgi:hypothetical protein